MVPDSSGGSAVVALQSKSRSATLQTSSPSVRITSIFSGGRCPTHHAISCLTQRDAAASGEGEEQERLGEFERAFDRGPEGRAGRQAGLVAKDAQGPQAVPRPGEIVQGGL